MDAEQKVYFNTNGKTAKIYFQVVAKKSLRVLLVTVH